MRVFVAWSCLAAVSLAAPVAVADTAGATNPATTCEAHGATAAAAMLDRFKDAIATRHPDKVTRLFAPDATYTAFHVEGVRASYDQIRDAFVYFLVTNPDIDFAVMTPSSGCGIVAIEGQGTWRRPAVRSGIEVETPVRIAMVLAETADGWRIQQYADTRLAADPEETRGPPAIEAQRRTPAVAGFVARSRVSTKPGPAQATADPDAYRAGRWIGDTPWFD